MATDRIRHRPSNIPQVRPSPLLSPSKLTHLFPANREHSKALSARQAIAQSRKSRGFFSAVFRRGPPEFRPTYKYRRDKSGSACRVFGSLEVKKVTGAFFESSLR